MKDPTFWILARATGLTAYVLLTLSTLAGLVVKSRPFGRALKAASVVDTHRFLSLLALGAIALHGLALTLDQTVRIGLSSLLVPGLSGYRPLATGLGVVAAELAGLIIVSFPLRKRIGPRTWRRLHWATYAMFALAAAQLSVEAETCELGDKHVVAGDKRISLADLARLSQQTGGGLIAQGTFIAPPTPYDTKRVEGHVYPAFHSPSFHAHAVDLSVDPDTGEVSINKYVVAQDVGFALNPTYIEGQIEGGVAQGLGQALSEEIVYEGGRVLNANLTDYKMPTTLDMPRVETILVQYPSLVGPYGAKGVGEPPNVEPPAAVANAVAAATGLRVTTLPITAEKIALGLRDAGGAVS